MYKPESELSQRNARLAVQAGLAAIAGGQLNFDLSGLGRIDSSAVAAMLAWQRGAQAQGLNLQFHAVPAGLLSLIALYGLSEQFTLTAAGRH
ncbi:MAG: STAS domain-containing protein [Burkholderiales bacterium]|nr:STAS domain-containing protein [Burkholderiales bacterium]